MASKYKNMSYIHKSPSSPSFKGKGLYGYALGPLRIKDVEVLYVMSETGHDTYLVSHKVTRLYYILGGNGHFTIEDHKHDVSAGMLVEVPPKVEYSYSGRMTLLVFCKPRWSSGNDTFTKWNSDVVGMDSEIAVERGSLLKRLVGLRIFGKSPVNAYLRFNQRVWDVLSPSLVNMNPIRSYGHFLNELARMRGTRAQAFSTFFLRNRPQLELLGRLLEHRNHSEVLRVAVIGCSAGAEAYSVAWRIKSARPDLRVALSAMDISKDALEIARCGAYPVNAKTSGLAIRDCMAAGHWLVSRPDSPLVGAEVFERMTPGEMEKFFDRASDFMRVKSWIKQGIDWQLGDARDPHILDAIGLQDVVVANNFLCHMGNAEAESCLRNIARLVKPQGYLFVSGIDLDVRTKVAQELGWEPIQDLLEQIHEGDSCLRRQWPTQYAGLEPLNKKRPDWKIRYAAAFKLGAATAAPSAHRPFEDSAIFRTQAL